MPLLIVLSFANLEINLLLGVKVPEIGQVFLHVQLSAMLPPGIHILLHLLSNPLVKSVIVDQVLHVLAWY